MGLAEKRVHVQDQREIEVGRELARVCACGLGLEPLEVKGEGERELLEGELLGKRVALSVVARVAGERVPQPLCRRKRGQRVLERGVRG